ncbi:MAG: hypothetical protein FWF36_02810 [Propionibacteriaceae bacterium]|nr:hypothetical protein [Propionibacteriaceae bacterium]
MSGVPLTAVKSNKRLGNVPFALGLAGVMVVGMVGLLALNINIQSGSAELRQDQSQAKALGDEVSALRAEVDRVGSVTSLAQQASAIGMCPNTKVAFLDLGTGAITGDATPLPGNAVPRSIPDPSSTTSPITIKLYPTPTPTPAPTVGDQRPSDDQSPSDDVSPTEDQTAAPLSAGGN